MSNKTVLIKKSRFFYKNFFVFLFFSTKKKWKKKVKKFSKVKICNIKKPICSYKKSIFWGHFCVTHSQRNGETDRKVFLQSCLVAAKKQDFFYPQDIVSSRVTMIYWVFFVVFFTQKKGKYGIFSSCKTLLYPITHDTCVTFLL